MITLYQKVPKTVDNLYGIKECKTNPFLEGPCLLCISAQPTFNKSVFGITSEGMRLAGLRTSEDIGMGYDIKSFPIKFLAIKNNSFNKEEGTLEFVNKYLVPLISKDNQRISYLEAISNMRQVNIMTYCDGAKTYLQIELFLREKMLSFGYTNQEIIDILSQCAFIPVGTNNPQINYNNQDFFIDKSYATTYQFLDLADEEITDERSYELLAALNISPISSINEETDYYEIINLISEQKVTTHKTIKNGNKVLQYYLGTGNHSLKEYTAKKSLTSLSLSMIINNCLLNSIKNKKSGSLVEPLRIDTLLKPVNEALESSQSGTLIDTLITEYGQALTYPDATRYSSEESLFMTNEENKMKEQYQLNISFNEYYKSCLKIKEQIISLLSNLSQLLDKEITAIILQNIPITTIDLVSSEVKLNLIAKEQVVYYRDLSEKLNILLNNLVHSLITNVSKEQAYQVLHDASLNQYSSYLNKGGERR